MNSLLIEKLRNETLGCRNRLHFNNAGASLLSAPVVTAIKQHLDLEAEIGGYEAATLAFEQIERFYDAAAELINCSRDEIAFTENATRAWDMIFYSQGLEKGDRIITSESEYASNYLAFLHRAKQIGIQIEVISNDATGQLDVDQLAKKLSAQVKLIAITHVPSQGGLINPVIEVGKLAAQWNIPYLLDATQSIGQMPVDVQAIGCDFLCATGRKFLRGPRGTGFLYVKNSRIAACAPPFVELHNADWVSRDEYRLRTNARRFETWEQNIAGKIGLSVAIDYALSVGLDAIATRVNFLANTLRQSLQKNSNLNLQDLGKHQCGIVTFSSRTESATAIQQALAQHKINVGVVSQAFSRLDLEKRNIAAVVRASLHYYNTEAEIIRFTDLLSRF